MFFKKKRINVNEVKTTAKSTTRELPAFTVVNGNKRNSSGMISYQAAGLQGIGARERQEDSFALVNTADVTKIIEKGLLAVVCDGMGGLRDGKLIREAAVNGFVACFDSLNRDEKEQIPGQLTETCRMINEDIRAAHGSAGGTTAVLVLAYDSELYWLAVGDSLIFLKRGGSLIKLNKEHVYLNDLYLKELGRKNIDKREAESDEQKDSLTEYIGKAEIGEMDYNKRAMPLGIGDVILLCSDGVSSYISEQEISRAMDLPPREACAQLEAAVRSKNNPAQDNYTCIFISCV